MTSPSTTTHHDLEPLVGSITKKLLKGDSVFIGSTDGRVIADRLYKAQLERGEILRFHKDEFFAYRRNQYVAMSKAEFDKLTWEFINNLYDQQAAWMRELLRTRLPKAMEEVDLETQIRPRPVSEQVLGLTHRGLRALCFVPDHRTIPTWVDDEIPKDYISVENGLLSVGTGDLHPHSHQWFSVNKLPITFTPTAECERWVRFIEQALPDPADRLVLQQWFGYVLGGGPNSRKRFLVLEGAADSGKSTVAGVLRGLLGDGNVSDIPLEKMGGQFALHGLYGKLLNISSESSVVGKSVLEAIKQVSGGDAVDTDRKNLSRLSFVPTAKLMIVANQRPVFKDPSKAIMNRLLLLQFRWSIPEKDQVPDMHRVFLAEEGSGILRWALEGLRTLRSRGQFVKGDEMKAELEMMQELDNPVVAFCHANFEMGSVTDAMPCSEAYQHYVQFGDGEIVDEKDFGSDLKAVFPLITRKRLRTKGKGRGYVYVGLRRVMDEDELSPLSPSGPDHFPS